MSSSNRKLTKLVLSESRSPEDLRRRLGVDPRTGKPFPGRADVKRGQSQALKRTHTLPQSGSERFIQRRGEMRPTAENKSIFNPYLITPANLVDADYALRVFGEDSEEDKKRRASAARDEASNLHKQIKNLRQQRQELAQTEKSLRVRRRQSGQERDEALGIKRDSS